jgi:hypothetical protein
MPRIMIVIFIVVVSLTLNYLTERHGDGGNWSGFDWMRIFLALLQEIWLIFIYKNCSLDLHVT